MLVSARPTLVVWGPVWMYFWNRGPDSSSKSKRMSRRARSASAARFFESASLPCIARTARQDFVFITRPTLARAPRPCSLRPTLLPSPPLCGWSDRTPRLVPNRAAVFFWCCPAASPADTGATPGLHDGTQPPLREGAPHHRKSEPKPKGKHYEAWRWEQTMASVRTKEASDVAPRLKESNQLRPHRRSAGRSQSGRPDCAVTAAATISGRN